MNPLSVPGPNPFVSYRTRCSVCCTCGRCAGTRMSSTPMQPGGSWTSPLPAQSRSSDRGGQNRGSGAGSSHSSHMGRDRRPPVATDLGTRLLALPCSLPGQLQNQLDREGARAAKGCTALCPPRAAGQQVTRARKPDSECQETLAQGLLWGAGRWGPRAMSARPF